MRPHTLNIPDTQAHTGTHENAWIRIAVPLCVPLFGQPHTPSDERDRTDLNGFGIRMPKRANHSSQDTYIWDMVPPWGEPWNEDAITHSRSHP